MPDQEPLTLQLLEEGVIDQATADQIRRLRAHGAGELYALATTGHQLEIWQAFARWMDLTLLTHSRQLLIFQADLMDVNTTLEMQLLPWREVDRAVHLIGYDPRAPDMGVRLDFGDTLIQGPTHLATPALWRELFELAYPRERHAQSWLSRPQAEALASMTPYFSEDPDAVYPLTPEAQAEAASMETGHHFVDPRLEPPTEDAAQTMELNQMIEYGIFPHHIESSRLMVLTDALAPLDEYTTAELKRFLGYEIGLLLCTAELIEQCITAHARRVTASAAVTFSDDLFGGATPPPALPR